MFKVEGCVARIIITLALYVVLFWVFIDFGWLELTTDLSTTGYFVLFAKTFGLVVVIELIVAVVIYILLAISVVIHPAITCVGLFALLLGAPFLNYKILEFAGSYTHLYTMADAWWQMWIIGFSFSIFSAQAPSSKTEKKSEFSWTGATEPTYSRAAVAGVTARKSLPPYNEPARQKIIDVVIDKNHCAHCGQKVLESDRCCPFCGAAL